MSRFIAGADRHVESTAAPRYPDLQAEIIDPLQNFEEAYAAVRGFYEALPWPEELAFEAPLPP